MTSTRVSWIVCLSAAAALAGPPLPAAAGPNEGPAVAPGLAASATTGGDACVSRSLKVVKGAHVLGATRGDTPHGSAVVRFDSNITGCVYLATVGACGVQGIEDPGLISTARRYNDPSAVYVDIRDPTGKSADRSFHLAARCE